MSERFIRVLPTEPNAKPGERYRIERGAGEANAWIVEEEVWPEKVHNPDANHIRETHDSLLMTPDHQAWFHGALRDLLGIDDLVGRISKAWRELREFDEKRMTHKLGIDPGERMATEQRLTFRLHELLDELDLAMRST